jgi:hypothetical protein
VHRRHHWARRSEQLDPVRDHREVSLGVSAYDFPWDTLQALSFALFRTYAVPSIGSLLFRTGEFTERTQKRYDDTGILLEEVQRHGLDSTRGRAAVRRINRMHAAHDISDDDMRYVLSTFVVVPKRWLDDHGWRSMTPHEVVATTEYYRRLGQVMNIRDLPEDFDGFERLMDAYEREHFAFDAGGRAVADATLDLMATQWPNSWLPRRLVRRLAWSLMDEPLLRAFHYPVPGRAERAVFAGALRLRAWVLRVTPARSEPRWVSTYGYFRTYPAGYEIDELGTFAAHASRSASTHGGVVPSPPRSEPGEAAHATPPVSPPVGP